MRFSRPQQAGNLTMLRTTFDNNAVAMLGVGALLFYGGELLIDDCSFTSACANGVSAA